MEILAFAIVVLVIPTLGVAYLVKKTHDKDLDEWNKENKKKFSNYGDLKIHLRDLEDKAIDEERSEASRLRDYRRDKKQREINEQSYKDEEKSYVKKQAKERAQFRKELEDQIKEEDKIKELEDKIKRERKEDKIKELEDKIKRAPKKESFAKTTFSGGGLTSKITRLKKLYKSGTLTKAEFEKAKNNLLK